MPTYKNHQIILSEAEAQKFFKELLHPDQYAADLRDLFLQQAEKTFDVVEFEDRVLLKPKHGPPS